MFELMFGIYFQKTNGFPPYGECRSLCLIPWEGCGGYVGYPTYYIRKDFAAPTCQGWNKGQGKGLRHHRWTNDVKGEAMSWSDSPNKRLLDVKKVARLGDANMLTPDVLP